MDRLRRAASVRARMILTRVNPVRVAVARARRRRRDEVDATLARLSMASGGRMFAGAVLVDGTFDNPNHWVRYAIFRASLGLSHAHEVGLVGPWRVRESSRTFEAFGIRDVVAFDPYDGDAGECLAEARRLLAVTRTPEDVLRWRLPHGLPAEFVYDGIIKRQRAACVDLRDPRLPGYVAEALGSLRSAARLIGSRPFSLVVLSHVINFQYAAVAWLALQARIPVVVLYGEFGVFRLVKLTDPAQIWETTNRPDIAEFVALPVARAEALAAVGRRYLEMRRGGRTRELAAILAFQRRTAAVTRPSICDRFGWEPSTPIIAVYASNWFDLPHMYGMSHFRDFLDWLRATVAAAYDNSRVNWLFKAHPCDDWYGGITLSDLMPRRAPGHVQLVPRTWNGAALMEAADGLVTYHGTAGIEFAAIGKPVLLADRGWYHELGIGWWPRSRAAYVEALSREWWKEIDVDNARRHAEILAGWHFCRPAWQEPFVLEDDPVQDPIYDRLPGLLDRSEAPIARERETLAAWFSSAHPHYHTYKMGTADGYTA